jgi:hypothetical protein
VNGFVDREHDWELQVITASPLISTIHKSPQHPLISLPTCFFFTSRSLETASNSGDSSASRTQVLFSQPPVQNSTELTLSLVYIEDIALLLLRPTAA